MSDRSTAKSSEGRSPDRQSLRTDREPRHQPDVMPMHRQVIREMDEPDDGVAPTPVWLMFFYFGLLMWGGYYLAANHGGFRADVFNEDPAVLYRGGEARSVKPVDPMVLGKRVYNNCTQCHQPDGSGVVGTFPPLLGSERVAGPPHVLAAILLHGLDGPVEVAGQRFSGQMPAWGQLSDQEIAGVLTYIRQSWGHQFEPVPAELVTAVRAATGGKAGSYTDAALDAMAQQPAPTTSDTSEADTQ